MKKFLAPIVAAVLAAAGLQGGTGVQAHGDSGGKFAGLVVSVSNNALPAELTLATASGERIVTVSVTTQFELDDNDQEDEAAEEDTERGFRANPALLTGRFVTVEVDRSLSFALEVTVESIFETSGVVINAGSRARSPVLTLRQYGGGILRLRITGETELRISPLTLDQLEGRWVDVEYDPQTGAALEIEAAIEEKRAAGIISSVDPAARTLLLSSAAGPLLFEIAPGAEIDINFQPAAAADLQPGTRALVRYREDGRDQAAASAGGEPDGPELEATRISAVTEVDGSVRGTVESTSVTGQTITIIPSRLRDGSTPITLKVDPASRLKAGGRPVGPASLQAGSRIRASTASSGPIRSIRSLRSRKPTLRE